MRKKLLSLIAVISVLLFLSCSSKKLPQEAKDMLINNSNFSKPIYISVPNPDSKERYDNIVNTPTVVDNSFIPSISVGIDNRKKLEDFNKSLVSFLQKNKYLEIKSAQQTTVDRLGGTTNTYEFILYTPTGQSKLIRSGSGSEYSGNVEYAMRGGIRKFKSFEFENSYKQNLYGVELRIYSVRFSYTIEPTLAGLEGLKNQIFAGEAQLYKDPNTEQWEIEKLDLADNGNNIITNIIQQNYPESYTVEASQSISENAHINPETNFPEIKMGQPITLDAGKTYRYWVPSGTSTFTCGLRGESRQAQAVNLHYSFGNTSWERKLTLTSWDYTRNREPNAGNVYYQVKADKKVTLEMNRY